jgi:hypothetical protein
LDVKGAIDELVSRFERDLDHAGLGIHNEGLMLGECGWGERGSESQNCEGFHCTSLLVV